jgi:DNA repair exonuclease SbcCD ATPase subunit
MELMNSGKQTDTPRTETYVLNPHPQAVPAEFARELELEAVTYKNEALSLRDSHDLLYRDYQKLEAEVERLDHLLADASETNHKLAAEVERLQTLPESRHKAFLDLLERGEKAQAEVKEIRAALGDDGRRTHKELIQLATKASEWRTWKEKYMDLRNAHIAEGQDPAGTIWEHADKLQKELKETKAENQKLRARLNQVQGCDCDNYLQTYCDKHNPHINP